MKNIYYKISIVTITKNDLENLQKTMCSIRNQDCQNFEHIIIDGASTDGTQKFLSNYTAIRTKVISERDTGIYDAMNKGVKYSEGQYLLYLNGGDELYDKTIITKLINKIKDDDTKLYYGDVECVTNEKNREKKIIKAFKNKFMLRHIRPPAHPSILFPRTFLEENPYDCRYNIAADHKLKIQAIGKLSVEKLEFIFSKFFIGGVSTSSNYKLIFITLMERARTEVDCWGYKYLPIALIKLLSLGLVRLYRRRRRVIDVRRRL